MPVDRSPVTCLPVTRPPVTRLLVNAQDISQTQIETTAAPELADGEVRVRVERYALTANNITYAALGDALKYWQFFPAPSGWGVVPVWGFGVVSESRAAGVDAGTRIWGYLPMADEVVLQPVKVSRHGFADGAPHRAGLADVYNGYSLCAQDPLHRDGEDDLEALLRPLFMTAWLIDDYFADNDFFGAKTLVLSSASSKTAYATAAQLHARSGVEVVGLTATRNLAFVRSLGLYHRVLSYDDIAQLDAATPSAYIDFAGNGALRLQVHTHLQDLRHSALIGAAHVGQAGGAATLPGPKPTFFFAPKQIAKRGAEWGMPVLWQRMTQAWRDFITAATQTAAPWIVVQQHVGAEAAQAVYLQLLKGEANASTGHMIRNTASGDRA
jgi:hypothetical protein